jgi:uncharacterized protein with HEPN domain
LEHKELNQQAKLARMSNLGKEFREYQETLLQKDDEIQIKRMIRWRDELLSLYHKKSLKRKYETRYAQIVSLCPTFESMWNQLSENGWEKE